MSTAVQIYDKVADTLAFTERLGEAFYKSGMFGCKSAAQGQMLALACASEKQSPIAIKRRYHMIDGELSMRADAMLAEFRGRGGKHEILSRTADKAEIRLTLADQSHVESLTWVEAQAEPFVWQKDGKTPKKNWATPRARKQTMWARVVSDGVRAICPEVCAGAYTPEELDHDAAAVDGNGKSPSAADVEAMLKDAAAKVGGQEEEIDASFTVVPDQPAQAATADKSPCATGTTTPAGIAANDPDAVRPADKMPCTADMREKIELYFDQLGMTQEQRESALKKRGVSVVRSLTINAAVELINKLQEKMAAVAASSVPAPAAQADEVTTDDRREAADWEPCLPDQEQIIRSLLTDIGDPALSKRVKAKLVEAGLDKIRDLSIADATALIEALKVKSIEAWAERALQVKPKN